MSTANGWAHLRHVLGQRPSFTVPPNWFIDPTKPNMADLLIDSLGVNVRLGNTATAYADFSAVENALTDLRLRYVRDVYGSTLQPAQFTQLAAIRDAYRPFGIRVNLFAPSANIDNTVLRTLIRDQLGGGSGEVVNAVEGPMNWDQIGSPIPSAGNDGVVRYRWANKLRDYQQGLASIMNANILTRSLFLLAPVLGGSGYYWQYPGPASVVTDTFIQKRVPTDPYFYGIGDISAWAEGGNIQLYPGAYGPDSGMSTTRDAEKHYVTPSTPGVNIAEIGWHNGINATDPSLPELQAGYYAARLPLDAGWNSIKRTFLFELVDSVRDDDLTNSAAHYGLYAFDAQTSPSWRAKPAAVAIRNLALLFNDPGDTFTPASLDYAISGAPADFRSILFQKRNGTWLLAAWRNARLWDKLLGTWGPVFIPPVTTTVTFPQTRNITVYKPATSAVAQDIQTGVTTISVDLDVEPQILVIS